MSFKRNLKMRNESDNFSSLNVKKSLSDDSDDDSDNETHIKEKVNFSNRAMTNKGYGNFSSKRKMLSDDSDDNNTVDVKVKKSKADFAKNFMKKMGYKEGKGLGVNEQGLTAPIETSTQKGRRGLGFVISDIQLDEDFKWDPDDEEKYTYVKEEVIWSPETDENPYSVSEMKKWLQIGPKKKIIDDEVKFCDKDVVKNVVKCKSVFDRLSGVELRTARSMSNPFESIGKAIFQNRAALKMANMDAITDFMFTNPKDEDNNNFIQESEPLYFADICAGPGGFSEYILWKKGWQAKGFGFTLKGENDFKLNEFFAGTPETFEPHYGVGGVNGDGNIYSPKNLVEFRDFVLCNTNTKGVHFVMADGGFSVEGEENLQEILSKRLYLCQFMCALSILRRGGHFVCKLFDIFTPFSVGLIFLMYKSFKRIAIHKPNSSRPANSERYIICKGKRANTESVENYLFEINCRLDIMEKESARDDILELVSSDILEEDKDFFDYIYKSNTQIGRRQIHFLLKVKAFAENPALKEARQGELKKECLAFWAVPNKSRVVPQRPDSQTKFNELISRSPGTDKKCFDTKPAILTVQMMKEQIEFPNSFKVMVLSASADETNKNQNYCRGLFLGVGGFNVHFWSGSSSEKWKKVDARIQLPPDTLVYAEKVQELRGEGKAQRHTEALHIIDAIFLGGIDMRSKRFEERIMMTRKLVKAITKTSLHDRTTIRVKHVYDLVNLEMLFEDLEMKELKSGIIRDRLCHKLDETWFIVPSGALLLNCLAKPWISKISNSSQKLYYFNCKNNTSRFDCPRDAIADFECTYNNSLLWKWSNDECLLEANNNGLLDDSTQVTRTAFMTHIRKVLQR